jgi:LTXXQ motif family protein
VSSRARCINRVTTMKRMTGGLLVLATVMATGAADLTAQRERRGMQMRGDQGQRGGVEMIMQARERLELTDAQISQLDALRRTGVARRTAAMAEMAELQSQLTAGQIQRSEVMAAMEARRDESDGIARAHRTQIESILTEAQRESLQQAAQQRGRAQRAGQAARMRQGARSQGARSQGARSQRGMRGNRGVRGQRGDRGQRGGRGHSFRGRGGPGGQGFGAQRGRGMGGPGGPPGMPADTNNIGPA